ncbi:MAG: asparagine synthase (glutamine-hydrolyzing) [Minisyncoccia bacterium]
MCGIAGFVGQGDVSDLEKMTASLSNRGPDDSGLFCEDGVGLGHTRLSIIDLSPTGHQPMFSSDKKVGIVFNGEMYNYLELKEELRSQNYNFKSTSDTEVIIALYIKYGEKCFEKMNGMFALAIYDFEKGKLILARDRLGKKPLYWAIFDNTLIFGSELKSLLKHPSFVKEMDPESLELYLQLDYVPTPKTIYKNVFKLEPASFLKFQNGQYEVKKFWELGAKEEEKISLSDAMKKLHRELQVAVKSRMISDVPLGVFLSGGLDSSTVAYYAKNAYKNDIHTFSIGFKEKSFDESKYAIKVAKYLGTTHHHKIVSARDCFETLDEIVEIFDEPVADASVIPTYLLSKFAKESVTVAIGGDGGDELFAGYPTFQADKYHKTYLNLPSVVKKLISVVISLIPATDNNFGLKFKLQKFIEGIDKDRFMSHQNWLGTFSRSDLESLLRSKTGKNLVKDYLGNVLSETKIKDEDNKLLYSYMRTYMMDEVLVKVDRASMFASLETRSPFLDYRLVEFVFSLPYSFKLYGFKTKFILKMLMSTKLPRSIVWRKKKGFGIPLTKWLKGDLKEFCLSLLSKENILKQGIFDYEFIEKTLNEHFSNKQDNRKKIWNLMVFQMWYRRYMK